MSRLIPQVTVAEESELLVQLLAELEDVHRQLPRYFMHRLKRNPSAAMPYHGNLHLALFLKVLFLFDSDERYNFTRQEFAALLSAAIHHDYDYRTTERDDWENIEAARAAWLRGADFWPTGNGALVSELIEATYLGRELSPSESNYVLKTLMRDADLLGWIFPAYRSYLKSGLAQEKGVEPLMGSFQKHFVFYHELSKELLTQAGLS